MSSLHLHAPRSAHQRGRRCTIRCALLMALAAVPAAAQNQHGQKRTTPVARSGGAAAVSQDVGEVAVIVDNGLIVTAKNPFDLNGRAVRFTPAGSHQFVVTSSPAVLDPVYGPALAFGYPAAALWPGDDDTQEVPFPAGFPFFGTTWTRVWVNVDGNLTFGAPDFASDERDKNKQVLGPPRISAYLFDVNPANALNTDPAARGSIHAIAKTQPDRLVVTWNDVADWQGGISSTFQLTLFATGEAEAAIDHIDPAAKYGVSGIAEGHGAGQVQQLDLSQGSAQPLPAGAVIEAFATYTAVSDIQAAREFYKTHADHFDFLAILTDFSTDGLLYSRYVSNHTHGIGTPLEPSNGQPWWPTVYDFAAEYGSGGELEDIVYMNNVFQYWPDAERLVNPPIDLYRSTSNLIQIPESFGWPVTWDGQTMTQVRLFGTLPPDNGELSRFYGRTGSFSNWLMSPMALMGALVERRWGTNSLFVHPEKGVGFDSYDLLGRRLHFWSFFFNSAAPAANFPSAPRFAGMEGNHILDLGTPATWRGTPTALAPGEHLFWIPDNQLADGFCMLDLHLMGLIRADEVGAFFYVDEPKSLFTGQELDAFDPQDPLNTAATMRCWAGRGDFAFKGRRVDLSIANIQEYEKMREGRDNQRGRRFWGPRGNLRVRYSSSTGRVDPQGDASITLSEHDRELGDEADRIEANGTPIDVKTMAFVLVVESGTPLGHQNAIDQVDKFRRTWQQYANGPATGGRGKFDTRLDPPVH